MSPFRFLCLGVGDAFSERWYGSSVAMEAEGQWLLLDCPHPIHKVVREASEAAGVLLTCAAFSGLLLTHLHADHASGVEGLAFKSLFAYKRKLSVICHPLVADRIWENHLAAGMDEFLLSTAGPAVHKSLDDYIAITRLSDDAPTQFGPFSIECRRTIHHVPTFAMRIAASGRTLGWSSDTAYDEGLIDWLSSADLIVHETNLGLHTPYEKLAALPAELRAKMRLNHFTDDFDIEGSAIECLAPGQFYGV